MFIQSHFGCSEVFCPVNIHNMSIMKIHTSNNIILESNSTHALTLNLFELNQAHKS